MNSAYAKKLTIYLPKTLEDQPAETWELLKKAKKMGAKVVENAGAKQISDVTGQKPRTVPYSKATLERNKLIMKDADAVVAIQHGTSRGTQHAIRQALEEGLDIKHIDEEVEATLLRKVGGMLKKKPLGSLKGIIKGMGKIVPGIANILDAVDYGILWKELDNLEKDIAAGTATERQKRIWEYVQQQREASEEWFEELGGGVKIEDEGDEKSLSIKAESNLDLFLTKDIEEDLKDPRERHKQLVADLRYLGNQGYPKLKENKSWGDWSLKKILTFFGAIVDTLRTECFYPYTPPKKDDPSYDSSFWKCYRESIEKGFLKTKPPKKQQLADWAKKRKELLKFSENLHSGLYLTEPHSEYIWTGVKPTIVKSIKFEAHIDEPLYLLSKDRCWGIIKLSEPEEIKSEEEFKKQYADHLIEDFERKDWWDEKLPLFKYAVEMVERFDQPKKVELPQGAEVFLKPESIKFND